jgi:predicted RNase H-like HicB family nuclease
VYALERRDVGQDEVVIRQNLDGTGQIKVPKNGQVREVILPPPAREALVDVPARLDVPWLFVTPRGSRFSKSSHLHYWRLVRAAFGRPKMHFYELRHFCATHLLEVGVSHADVAVQLGHTDGGALVMSTYGHPSEEAARERLKRAYTTNIRRLSSVPEESGEARWTRAKNRLIRRTWRYPDRMAEQSEFEFVFEPQDEGGYHVYAPDLPGLHTQGEDIDEATENAQEALALYVEGLREEGRPVGSGIVRRKLAVPA